eukprot:4026075-Prymnesium_polylepis.1
MATAAPLRIARRSDSCAIASLMSASLSRDQSSTKPRSAAAFSMHFCRLVPGPPKRGLSRQ